MQSDAPAQNFSAPDGNKPSGPALGPSRFFFDRRDHELLEIVNDVLDQSDSTHGEYKRLLAPHLHPHGIKEMAAPRGLRIAYAVVKLLESLELGLAEDRLKALSSLRNEVLNLGGTDLPINTARVLLQIMKELIRAKGDKFIQLQLARDFRQIVLGRPRIVRQQLKKYYLLEVPEDWNQVMFDDHVHDANTKGRKSATHLVMDAWIKGIRKLTVVYYNYIRPEVASELLEAGKIMGMQVSIGIELSARFWDRYVKFIWTPHCARDPRAFLNFLDTPKMREFSEECRKITVYREQYIDQIITAFNERHLPEINTHFGVKIQPVQPENFASFVGAGQPSLLHLSKYIYNSMMEAFAPKVETLYREYLEADQGGKAAIAALVREMNIMDSEEIISRWLSPERNPDLHNPFAPCREEECRKSPAMLLLSPAQLVERLGQLYADFNLTLEMENLCTEDILEILYDCGGFISHLEIFNLKNYVSEKRCCPNDWIEVNELQRALNTQNVTVLKRILQDSLTSFEYPSLTRLISQERKVKFVEILFDLDNFRSMYRNRPLKTRLGSSSTGRSRHLYGMGLTVCETLPARVQRQLHREQGKILPVQAKVRIINTSKPRASSDKFVGWIQKNLRRLPVLNYLGYTHHRAWKVDRFVMEPESGHNVAAVGGIKEFTDNNLRLLPQSAPRADRIPLRYLNSHLKNLLKVLLGFIPAFATFSLTNDWWLLAYFGAVIWFGITGIRNVIQSVLGGGGFRRSPLLRWNSYVSWERITDSLLYTGFSVPLLDYVVKTLLLDRGLGITTATNPVALYSIMALANGIYISSHNVFRGLPKTAAFGNFFRSILSIPLAVLFNSLAAALLGMAGVTGIESILQKWAAIISKLASDFVAAVIEGFADRLKNMALREKDYQAKLKALFEAHTTLELLFPETSVLAMLESPKQLMCILNSEEQGLEKIIIIHSLDLLYFWMYQPRARSVLKKHLEAMTEEDRQVFIRSQGILLRHKDISQMFVDGIVGKNFSKALAFYLDRSAEYLEAMQKLGVKYQSPWSVYRWDR